MKSGGLERLNSIKPVGKIKIPYERLIDRLKYRYNFSHMYY